ncbi:uridine kinase family protein [Vallitalea okinawensis]|uniref:uridine kinase family protein n=1 Tax=Vallitalea okinawensis TaxID=2078660 RepID=UPI000CFD4365|nr:AAA family ATPase [Vallitalea okinawensis]
MDIQYKKLADYLNMVIKERGLIIIAIDGPGGSGKSYFSDNLNRHLHKCQIIHFDDFYLESDSECHTSSEIGSSFDWTRLESEVLIPLKKEKKAFYRKYDWIEDKVIGNYEVIPEGIIIIEGVYSSRIELRDYYDYKIWVEADYQLRLNRGIERDGDEMREKWEEEWMPKEIKYIASKIHNPRENADIIIHGNSGDCKSFNMLKTKICF